MQGLTLKPSKLGRLRELTVKLLDEESMTAVLLKLCPGMLCVIDAHLHIIQVSDVWEKNTCWSTDQLVSEHLETFIHPSDVDSVRSVFGSLGKSERTTLHFRFRVASGRFIPLEWNVVLADDDYIYALATIIPQACFRCERAQNS